MKSILKSAVLFTLAFVMPFLSIAEGNTEFTEDIFVNLHAKGIEKGAKISWGLSCEDASKIENLVIRYQRKIDKGKPWKYSDPIDAETVNYKLEGMKGGEKYVWQIGCRADGGDVASLLANGVPDDSQIVWSGNGKVKTDRPWGLYKLLVLIGSLGLFIFGMKVMSDGLQQSAGGGLRKILGTMTSNRYLGVMSGFLITALVQSSSATTVMTVSFVNAGLLTLVESAGVMMGANIGTTITGWLVSLFGFKISISSYALIFIAIGAPFMFISRQKIKGWGNAVIGFAILFMGLGFLKDSVPDLGADSPIVQFFTQFSDSPFLGRLAFVFLGTLVTIVVQSSSAAMALTLTMVVKDIIPFEVGAAMILGENIGTTITAEIASLIGNVHAKRSARIHSMFNVIGVTWMVLLMPVFLKGISGAMEGITGMNPFDGGDGATLGLAAFHTTFNLTNVLVLIWFVPWLVKVATRTVKSQGEEDEIFKLMYISGGLTTTPELSVLEAKKEVVQFAELTGRMQAKMSDLINETNEKKQIKLIKKIVKYEDITDRLETEITSFLGNVSSNTLSESSSTQLRAMLSISNDLERIGDIYFEMAKAIEKKTSDKLWFDQSQRDKLNELHKKVASAHKEMVANLQMDYNKIDISKAEAIEAEINDLRNKIRKSHLKSIEKGEYNPKTGLIFSNLFSSMERVGDHIINVSEAASGINLQ